MKERIWAGNICRVTTGTTGDLNPPATIFSSIFITEGGQFVFHRWYYPVFTGVIFTGEPSQGVFPDISQPFFIFRSNKTMEPHNISKRKKTSLILSKNSKQHNLHNISRFLIINYDDLVSMSIISRKCRLFRALNYVPPPFSFMMNKFNDAYFYNNKLLSDIGTKYLLV